ncbi:unnamed protein product [Citrullus colocynthis]|uniref:Uncharacterized protein n=1 Tax=Citrullus colocynthis TaxID=252529 RepID=A0ABP0YKR9_9ROSI
MVFGDQLIPLWGKGIPTLPQSFLINQANIPESGYTSNNGRATPRIQPNLPIASLILDGFVPLWVIFSHIVGAYNIWGGQDLMAKRTLGECGGIDTGVEYKLECGDEFASLDNFGCVLLWEAIGHLSHLEYDDRIGLRYS